MMIWPIDVAKERNKNAGQHFFSPGAMRFFNSRVSHTCNGDEDGILVFVTSERFDEDPRRWTARVMKTDGSVEEIGEFQEYENGRAAWKAAINYLEDQDEI